MTIAQLITPLVTIVGMLVSVAVIWGALRATVAMIKEEVERLRGTTEKHEVNLDLFREEFVRFRERCEVWFAGQEAGKMYASGAPRKRARK